MKFLTVKAWIDSHGNHHEASPAQPHIFEFPKGEVPSITWFPLDKEAEKALEDLAADIKKRSGNVVRPHKIPPGYAVSGEPETIKKAPPPVNPDIPPVLTLKPQAASMSEIQKAAQAQDAARTRPADSEPTK
jgi:hypothetical protein